MMIIKNENAIIHGLTLKDFTEKLDDHIKIICGLNHNYFNFNIEAAWLTGSKPNEVAYYFIRQAIVDLHDIKSILKER